jgi:hypothetical protein
MSEETGNQRMGEMDHAAAHERIEDLVLDPVRLARLRISDDPADIALREHLDGCPTCSADLGSWSRLQAGIRSSLPHSERPAFNAVDPVDVPPRLRASVMASIHTDTAGTERPLEIPQEPEGPSPFTRVGPSAESTFPRRAARQALEPARARRPPVARQWLAIAASLVILGAAGAITVDQAGKRARAESEAVALATLAAAMDDVLSADHRVVELRTPAGASAGSIAWSRHDWVVLTSALTAPAAGHRYRCWLEDGASSVAVGTMDFSSGTAWWVATLDDWKTWEIGPRTRFVVTLEADGATTRTGTPVLEAALGS